MRWPKFRLKTHTKNPSTHSAVKHFDKDLQSKMADINVCENVNL